MSERSLSDVLDDPEVRAAIPGISLALLRGGEIAAVHAVGSRGAHDSAPVDVDTVFEAASLTKPLAAFIALQLAEEGRLDLRQPLIDICETHVRDDDRVRRITAAHVLTHTAGLPNIATAETPLKIYFEPGARFSYGSSAFAWLQRAIEKVAGQPLEDMAKERIFEPFGMTRSSLQWHERFEANHATGHEMDGQPVPKRRPQAAGASWSLTTTATDYARFVRAVLAGRGLSPQGYDRWFTPAVRATRGVDGVLESAPAEEDDVAWGLGWGLESSQGCFFHWGHNPGFRAFVIGKRATGDAVVWFANSARGLRPGRRVLPLVLPGSHSALDWLQVAQTLQE